MNAAFWAAVGGGATLLAVLLVLIGHMFSFAKGQGARDERENQTATRLGHLETRADLHAATVAEQATKLAVLAQACGAFERQLQNGLADVTGQLRHMGDVISQLRPMSPQRRKMGEEG